MSGGSQSLPFALEHRPGGVWSTQWREAGMMVVVAGTDAAPSAAHAATLAELVVRWREIGGAVEAYLAALADAQARVPFWDRSDWWFCAEDCGFTGRLFYQALSVCDPDDPTHAVVTFYTGLPDGYATYELVLASGLPVSITAYAA